MLVVATVHLCNLTFGLLQDHERIYFSLSPSKFHCVRLLPVVSPFLSLSLSLCPGVTPAVLELPSKSPSFVLPFFSSPFFLFFTLHFPFPCLLFYYSRSQHYVRWEKSIAMSLYTRERYVTEGSPLVLFLLVLILANSGSHFIHRNQVHNQ